jgi:hypothetical protein
MSAAVHKQAGASSGLEARECPFGQPESARALSRFNGYRLAAGGSKR